MTDQDKLFYDETDAIANYWDVRFADWLKNPDWGAYPHKQAWFNERFGHLLPRRQSEVAGGRQPIGRVLDYGCGVGLYAVPLIERFQTYVGFDTSPVALETARIYYKQFPDLIKRMYFNIYTGEPGQWQMGMRSEYDLIISITVLQHQPIPYRLAMIENIKGLLKPGGMYIGLEWADAYSQAYDMPPIPEAEWRDAWLPLIIERDIPAEHPEWRADNVWVAR